MHCEQSSSVHPHTRHFAERLASGRARWQNAPVMEFDKSNCDEIQHDIRPAMAVAILLPVIVEGYANLGVYVGASPYFTHDYDQADLEATIKSIAKKLSLAQDDTDAAA